MDFSYIQSLNEKLRERDIPKDVLQSFEQAFNIEYTHHSTAMEGNTLTLIETKAVIEDGISIGGKRLREIYEVANHNKTFSFAKKKLPKTLRSMGNIMVGGVYRNCDVAITGATHTPPTPNDMYSQIKYFYGELNRNALNLIELAAWVHTEFVCIHLFTNGKVTKSSVKLFCT